MVLQSSAFFPVYIAFLVLGLIERVTSTFSGKRTAPIQRLSKKWFFIPFYAYLILIIFSIGEFFIRLQTVNLALSIAGFVLYLIGVFLRRESISNLGENWSIYSEIRQDHALVTSGIYKILKHPYYLAVLSELSGACLVANAFYTLVLVIAIQGPLLLMRINLEERMLTNHFGEGYKKYARGKLF